MNKKNHFRAVFKSDHLGVADLEDMIEEGKHLFFTIERTVQGNQKVAGKNLFCNVAYFKEGIKPMVLNATNSKVVSRFASSNFVEDWNNIAVELYVDSNVKMKGSVVGGVRIRPTQPRQQKEQMHKGHKFWNMAIQKVTEGMTVDQFRTKYNITDELYEELKNAKV
jgi:hypothetical protein